MLVFEQDQDVCLLHGVLTHAFCEPNQCISIIANWERKLSSKDVGFLCMKDVIEKQIFLRRKWHAALFFLTLRSEGVKCKEADTYYSVLANHYYPMDWKFYIRLNFECKWSEYFIECACQLPLEILDGILKCILQIDWSIDLKNYSMHLVIQLIIWKTFILSDSSILEDVNFYNFGFDFKHTNFSANLQEDSLENFLSSYTSLLNHLSQIEEGRNLSSRIVLHGLKSLFCLLNKHKIQDENHFSTLLKIIDCKTLLAEEYIFDMIEKDFQQNSSSGTHKKTCLKLVSWEADIAYVLFVLINFIEPLLEDTATLKNSDCLLICNLKNYLQCLNPISNSNKIRNSIYVIDFLNEIINLEYPFSSCAAKILLSDSKNQDFEREITTLEKNIHTLSPAKLYKDLIDAILKVPENFKTRYLQLLHKVLIQELPLCNDAIEYILTNYPLKEDFVLPDFKKNLNELNRKSFSVTKAEKYVIPLIIQAPPIVMDSIVSQVILKGEEGLPIAEVLKHVPFACQYGMPQQPPMLLKELLKYFEKPELSLNETKNMLLLLNFFISIQSYSNIISYDLFLSLCIIPQIENKNSKKQDFSCECLNIILEAMLMNEVIILSNQSLNSLILCLATQLSSCIEDGHARSKEIIITSLNLLGKILSSRNKVDWAALSGKFYITKHDHLVSLYLWKYLHFFPEKFQIDTWSSLWTWFCLFEDIKLTNYQECMTSLSYEKILNILVPLFRHFTKEEWIRCTNLLEEYFLYIHRRKDFLKLPSTFKGNNQLHAVLQCLMDIFCFLSQENSSNLSYIEICFTNTTSVLLEKYDISPEELTEIFLNFAHLMTLNDIPFNSLSTVLITIHKQILEKCTNESHFSHLKCLLLESAKLLPKSDEKVAVISNLSTKCKLPN